MFENGFPRLGNLQIRLLDIFKNRIKKNVRLNLRRIFKLYYMYAFQEYENFFISTYFLGGRPLEENEDVNVIDIEGDINLIA